MSEKQLKTRIIHKHDIANHWKQAENFVPKQGELIIYDDRHTDKNGTEIIVADTVGFKIGNGVTNVNDLPLYISSFAGTGKNSLLVTGSGKATGDYSVAAGTADAEALGESLKQILTSGIVDFDFSEPEASGNLSLALGASCKAQSTGAISLGVANTAGIKGYYWKDITFNDDGSATISLVKNRKPNTGSMTSWLDNAEVFQQTIDAVSVQQEELDWSAAGNDYISIASDNNYMFCAKITGISTKQVSYSGYIYSGAVLGVDYPKSYSATTTTVAITVDSLPFTTADGPVIEMPDDYSIFAVERIFPTPISIAGLELSSVDMATIKCRSGAVELGWGAQVFGANNLGAGIFSQTFGMNNIQAGSFGLTSGRDNVGGYAGITGGMNNINRGKGSIIAGSANETATQANDSIVVGQGNISHSAQTFVSGLNNIINKGCGESIIAGGKNNQAGGLAPDGTTYYANNIFITGTENKGFNDNSITAGYSNTNYSKHSAVFGSSNTLNSGATCAVVGGTLNTVNTDDVAVFGQGNTVFSKHGLIAGYKLTQNSTVNNEQTILGKRNVANDAAYFIVGGGPTDSVRHNILELGTDGNLKLNGAKDSEGNITGGNISITGNLTANANVSAANINVKSIVKTSDLQTTTAYISGNLQVGAGLFRFNSMELVTNSTLNNKVDTRHCLFGDKITTKATSSTRAFVAMGEEIEVNADGSSTFGAKHVANSRFGFIGGYCNTTSTDVNNQTAFGKYSKAIGHETLKNESGVNKTVDAAFCLGNGTNSVRSNAVVMYYDGRIRSAHNTHDYDPDDVLVNKGYLKAYVKNIIENLELWDGGKY